MDRKDLGVHSELVSDGVIPLIEAGVITGARKNFKPRKIIVGFMLGTKKIFDFVDNNPIFEFHPTSYTNDPPLIARNDNMVAINSALQIDLTGQVCSDSIGNQFLQRHRRTSGLSAGRVALERRQADHRDFLDGEERDDFAHRSDAQPGSGSGDITRAGALCRDGVWRGVPARQIDPRAGQGADRDRASRNFAESFTSIARRRSGCSAQRRRSVPMR